MSETRHDQASAPAGMVRQLAALEPIFHRPELSARRAPISSA